jgi:hypothetical protein
MAGDIVLNVLRLAVTPGSRPSLNAAIHLTQRGVRFGVGALDGSALLDPLRGQPTGGEWHRLRQALGGRRIGRRDLLAAWRKYRAVAHLWAAVVLIEWQCARAAGLGTRPEILSPAWVVELAALSEAILASGSRVPLDRPCSGQLDPPRPRRRAPLLDARTAMQLIVPGLGSIKLTLPSLNVRERRILAARR